MKIALARCCSPLIALLVLACASPPAPRQPNAARRDPKRASSVQADPRTSAFALAKALGSGINLGNALEAPEEGAWGVTLSEQDFANVAQAGFTHVRIPVRWSAHAAQTAPYEIDESFAKRVDWAVHTALNAGLRAIVNVHHYNELIADPKANIARLIGIWRQISARYASYPETLYFELLNEPNTTLDEQWTNAVYAQLLPVVREKNPHRMVIVGPTQWNQIPKLPGLVLPEEDHDLIVTFHYYEPYFFTHQGATWDEKMKNVKGNVWPGPLGGKKEIEADFAEAMDWGRSHHRPLYLGEFGAFSASPMQYRKAWTKAVVDTALDTELPYAYWELRSGFGAFDSSRNAWRKELIDALLPHHNLPSDALVEGEKPVEECRAESLASSPQIQIRSAKWATEDRARRDPGPVKPDGVRDLELRVVMRTAVSAIYVMSVDATGKAVKLDGNVQQWDTVLDESENPLRKFCSPHAASDTWTLAAVVNGKLLNEGTSALPTQYGKERTVTLFLADSGALEGKAPQLRVYARTSDGKVIASDVFATNL
jgi:endoglucanase